MRDDGLIPRTGKEYSEELEYATEWYSTSNPYTAPSIVFQTSFIKKYMERSMLGYNTPNFHKRIKAGELIRPTPWHQFDSRGEILSGELDFRARSADGVIHHSYYSNPLGANITGGNWIITQADVENYCPWSYDEYVTNAADALYSQGFDLLTFAAELGDVGRLVKSICTQFLKVKLPPISQKKGRSVARELRRITAAWLGFRYGWRPLISDIKKLNEMVERLSKAGTIRHSKISHGTSTGGGSSYGGVQGGAFYYRSTTVDEVTYRFHGCVAADMSVPEFQLNPMRTGWELIPFSFVYDWFLNVGRTIGALSVISRSSSYVAAKGVTTTVQRRGYIDIENPNSTFVGGTMSRRTLATAYITRRDPCSIPMLPRPNLRLNPFKVFDLIALVVTRFKGWR